MKKKALLLTASYGTGHLTANRSVGNALKKLYGDEVETSSIDFLTIAGYLSTGGFFKRMYNWSMEAPIIWDTVYNLTNSPASQEYFNLFLPLFYSELYRMFQREKPDIFVLTHPYWNYIVGDYKKRYNVNTPCVTIVTDSTTIHRTWMGPGVDYYLVPDRETLKTMEVLGVDPAHIRDFGFPVDDIFTRENEFDRAAFLRENGLRPDVLTILFVIGLGSYKRILDLVELLRTRYDLDFQMLIVTGKYKSVYRELMKKTYPVDTKIVGWTDRMADHIRASDLVVTKGGGAIVMETLAGGRPIFIPVATPGQEKGNALLVKKYGLGVVERSFTESYRLLCYLIENPGRIAELKRHVATYRRPAACYEIAKFIHGILFPGA